LVRDDRPTSRDRYWPRTVEAIAGNGRIAIPAALFVFGVAGFIGNNVAGRMSDSFGPVRTAQLATGLMVVGLAALTPLVHYDLGTLGIVLGTLALVIWGLGGWAITPPQQLRLLTAAPDSGPTVLAANSSALYLGAAIGGLLGSSLLRTVGLTWIGIIAATLATTVLIALRHTENSPKIEQRNHHHVRRPCLHPQHPHRTP
jgi:predicted MFS family arabinose efflux permease